MRSTGGGGQHDSMSSCSRKLKSFFIKSDQREAAITKLLVLMTDYWKYVIRGNNRMKDIPLLVAVASQAWLTVFLFSF